MTSTRYVLPNPPGAPKGAMTTVGWDSSFGTFWTQCFVSDEQSMFRYGITPGEITTVEELAEVLRTHGVTIPPNIAHLLALDLRKERA